eukprot:scaffold1435_cov267-Pinguiococcus_pyrenoidosus.AAC.47
MAPRRATKQNGAKRRKADAEKSQDSKQQGASLQPRTVMLLLPPSRREVVLCKIQAARRSVTSRPGDGSAECGCGPD